MHRRDAPNLNNTKVTKYAEYYQNIKNYLHLTT